MGVFSDVYRTVKEDKSTLFKDSPVDVNAMLAEQRAMQKVREAAEYNAELEKQVAKENAYRAAQEANGGYDRLQIARQKVLNEAAKNIPEILLNEAIGDIYVRSLPHDHEYIMENYAAFHNMAALYMKKLGGMEYLNKVVAESKSPFLKKMRDIIVEASREILNERTQRAAKALNEEEVREMIQPRPSDEERNKVIDKINDLGTEELAELVNNKVIDVVTDERKREIAQNEFQTSLQNDIEESTKSEDDEEDSDDEKDDKDDKDKDKDSKESKEKKKDADAANNAADDALDDLEDDSKKEDKKSKKKDKDDDDEKEEDSDDEDESDDDSDDKDDKKKSKDKDSDDDDEEESEDDDEDDDKKSKKKKKKGKKEDDEDDSEDDSDGSKSDSGKKGSGDYSEGLDDLGSVDFGESKGDKGKSTKESFHSAIRKDALTLMEGLDTDDFDADILEYINGHGGDIDNDGIYDDPNDLLESVAHPATREFEAAFEAARRKMNKKKTKGKKKKTSLKALLNAWDPVNRDLNYKPTNEQRSLFFSMMQASTMNVIRSVTEGTVYTLNTEKVPSKILNNPLNMSIIYTYLNGNSGNSSMPVAENLNVLKSIGKEEILSEVLAQYTLLELAHTMKLINVDRQMVAEQASFLRDEMNYMVPVGPEPKPATEGIVGDGLHRVNSFFKDHGAQIKGVMKQGGAIAQAGEDGWNIAGKAASAIKNKKFSLPGRDTVDKAANVINTVRDVHDTIRNNRRQPQTASYDPLKGAFKGYDEIMG